MTESAGNWCLIESDPGVFTELIREFGMWSLLGAIGPLTSSTEVGLDMPDRCLWILHIFFLYSRIEFFYFYFFLGCGGLQVEELWSLDEEQFKNLEYANDGCDY